MDENPYSKVWQWGTETALSKLHNYLRKDTVACLSREQPFFNRIIEENINAIYSIGFSFSDPDKPYIRHLCEIMDTNKVTWHLMRRGTKEYREWQKNMLRECGYKGAFGKLILKIK